MLHSQNERIKIIHIHDSYHKDPGLEEIANEPLGGSACVQGDGGFRNAGKEKSR